jgi:hypothetical protein
VKATSFLFVGTHVGIYNILGCPVLRGGCKPETFFERGDAATHVSFARARFSRQGEYSILLYTIHIETTQFARLVTISFHYWHLFSHIFGGTLLIVRNIWRNRTAFREFVSS